MTKLYFTVDFDWRRCLFGIRVNDRTTSVYRALSIYIGPVVLEWADSK